MNEQENLDLDVSQNNNETLEVESKDSVEEEPVSDSEESLEAEQDSDQIDWKSRAIKAEKAIENAKKSQKQEAKPVKKTAIANPEGDLRAEIEALKLAERKRQFGYEHGLSPKETDRVFQINSDPDTDTLKDPFIKAGIEALRRQDRVANNSLAPSAKSGTFNPKKFNKLSAQEKDAEFRRFMKSKGALNG